jgi:hypothetical protein
LIFDALSLLLTEHKGSPCSCILSISHAKGKEISRKNVGKKHENVYSRYVHTKYAKIIHRILYAWMAELVDALDSKSGFCKEVGVRFPLQAPKKLGRSIEFFYFIGNLKIISPKASIVSLGLSEILAMRHFGKTLVRAIFYIH